VLLTTVILAPGWAAVNSWGRIRRAGLQEFNAY
jgi:hypothetical protein